MIPGAKDCDYHRGEKPFTIEEVKAFKEAYDDYGFIDKHHAIRDLNSANKHELIGNALKSFLLTEPTSYTWFDGSVHTYPTGTWMLTSQVTDPVAIKQAKEGKITGYSPSIFTRETAEKIRSALKEHVLKASAGGLIKDINDPVPVLVSLVHKPCQHGNKFCKMNIGESMSEDKAQSTLKQIRDILGFEDKPEYATKEDLDEIRESFVSALKSDEFKEIIGAMVNEAVTEAVKPIGLKEDKKVDEKEESEEVESEEGVTEEEEKPETEETSEEEDEDDGEEKKKTENKGLKEDSKALPQHDNNGKPAIKSDKAIVMEAMGRTNRGRPLKE